MSIALLRIADFRNVSALELAPVLGGMTIIAGNNGSGKTSLLEAIHYLSIGRSFRSSNSASLIRHTTSKFSVFAQIVSETERQIPLGVERDVGGVTRLKMNDKEAAVTELAYLLPIRLINSQSHQLFESGPTFRRKYLDWGLFYQYESFLPNWRHFERVLKQRNALLRDKRSKKELAAWTDEFVNYSLELDRLRQQYSQLLGPLISQISSDWLEIDHIEIAYQSGWDAGSDLATQLSEAFLEEYRLGHTQLGPHRADFEVKVKGTPVKHFLSRGQQKLLICAMIVAQGMLLAQQANKGLIYLIDDLPSELDLPSRQKLISLLAEQQTQIFITAIDSQLIAELVPENGVSMKVFHVEHGEIVDVAK